MIVKEKQFQLGTMHTLQDKWLYFSCKCFKESQTLKDSIFKPTP